VLKKILLPLDGSELAEKALPYAKVLAEKFAAELLVVRVVHPMHVLSDYYGTAAYESFMTAEQKATEAYLHHIQERLADAQFSVQTVPLHDLAVAEAIIDLACQEGIDLIVMSTHGRSGLSRWLYGSVATKVLQHAPCPIFLVKAMEAKADEAEEAASRQKEATLE